MSQYPPARRAEPTVLDEILAERHRQLYRHRYSKDHDDEHTDGALLTADWGALARVHLALHVEGNPTQARAHLIQAAALIVAEVERRDRAATVATDAA